MNKNGAFKKFYKDKEKTGAAKKEDIRQEKRVVRKEREEKIADAKRLKRAQNKPSNPFEAPKYNLEPPGSGYKKNSSPPRRDAPYNKAKPELKLRGKDANRTPDKPYKKDDRSFSANKPYQKSTDKAPYKPGSSAYKKDDRSSYQKDARTGPKKESPSYQKDDRPKAKTHTKPYEKGDGPPPRGNNPYKKDFKSSSPKPVQRDGQKSSAKPYQKEDNRTTERVKPSIVPAARSASAPATKPQRPATASAPKQARPAATEQAFYNERPKNGERPTATNKPASKEQPANKERPAAPKELSLRPKKKVGADSTSVAKPAATKAIAADPDAPMPLNKYIAHSGICSRRDAVELIKQGKVKVNGELIMEPGHKVAVADDVRVAGKKLDPVRDFVYILLNKPKDYITTTEDPQERKTVFDLLKNAPGIRIYPVGRLDRNTSGVLLLTNDGDLSQKLTHPSNEIKKVYAVTLDKDITKAHFEEVLKGVPLEDGVAFVDSLAIADSGNLTQLGIELHNGRNRVVRRIFEHLGYDVKALDRVTFAGLTKKNVDRGKWRFLTEREVRDLKFFNKGK